MLGIHRQPGLIPGPITAQRILDKPEREEDLGSDSSVSKKDAKLGFICVTTNLLLIPDPLAIGDVLCKMLALVSGSGIRAL